MAVGCSLVLRESGFVLATKHPYLDEHYDAHWDAGVPLTDAEDKELRLHVSRVIKAWLREVNRIAPNDEHTNASQAIPNEAACNAAVADDEGSRCALFDAAIAGYKPSDWSQGQKLSNRAWRVRKKRGRGEIFDAGKESERGWAAGQRKATVIKKDDGIWVYLTASHNSDLANLFSTYVPR